MGDLVCNLCGDSKSPSGFYPSELASGGRRCKECRNRANARWKKSHPERVKATQRRADARRREAHAQDVARRRAERPDEYRAASRENRRRAQAISRETAQNNGKEWTGPELELAADESRTAREVAALLGRTHAAVLSMRNRLRTDRRKSRMAGAERLPGEAST